MNKSKPCPADKVLNPKSNQCIKKGTQLHKSLIKKGILKEESLSVNNKEANTYGSTSEPKQKKKCLENEVLNPKSNQCIKKGTQLHKSLINEGVLSKDTLPGMNKENKVLNPKTNYWVVIGSATYNKLVKDGTISGEEMITSHKDYGKEVEIPVVSDTKKNETTDQSDQKSIIKLSPNVKKLFLNKIKNFIKKKNDLTISSKSVKSVMCRNENVLPKSTYVITTKTINYFTRNYFPTRVVNNNGFFFPNMSKAIIKNQYTINWNNFTQRYFQYNMRLDIDSKDKEFIDYDWLHECNLYIKNLHEMDKFRLYGYSFHGDVYVNSYLRGNLDKTRLIGSMKKYVNDNLIPTNVIFNPLFFEYLDVYKKTDEFYQYKTPYERFAFYKKCCSSIAYLNVNSILKLIENYNKNLNRILKNAPPLKKAMTLFRGSKSNYFQTLDKNKPFIHKGYMSATVDYNVALRPSFINHGTPTTCCLLVINVLPGTRLLPMTGLSQVNSENEFLMNTNSKVMIRKTEILPKIPSSNVCDPEKVGNINVTDVYIA